MIPLKKYTFFHDEATKKGLADFILASQKLSMGDKCDEFEKEFARFHKRKFSVLFNSGGSANLALIQASLNLGILVRGDKIGFSALTWSTNVMPLLQMGLVPIPIDCDLRTLNVMSPQLEEAITKEKIKGFFATNVLGLTGDLPAIQQVCKKHNILFFEDNCESLGTENQGILAGNFGEASTFSFFVGHHMSTIEGGCVCTDNDDLAEMLRIVRANGWDRNLDAFGQKKWRKKYNVASDIQAKYVFYDLAYNFRPTEITGFLGLSQLKHLPRIVEKLENNFFYLKNFIEENDELIPVDHSRLTKVSNFAFPVICRTPELRHKYIEQFAGGGIEIRPVIAGNITDQPFFKKYIAKNYSLPNTEFIHKSGFYCGNFPELSQPELELIASCLQK